MPADQNPVTNVWHVMHIFSTGPSSCSVAGAGGGNWEPTTSDATIELILQYLTNTKMTTIVTIVNNTEQTTIKIFAKNFGSKGFLLTLSGVPSSSSHFLSHFFPSSPILLIMCNISVALFIGSLSSSNSLTSKVCSTKSTVGWTFSASGECHFFSISQNAKVTTNFITRFCSLELEQAFNLHNTLVCSRSSWQLHRNSLCTTAYVCAGIGLAKPPFYEAHFSDLCP